MTSVTLNLNDELVERAKKVAKEAGVPLEKMLARIVEDALDEDQEAYELDEEEAAAVAEGLADMKAGRWISHEEMTRLRKAQRER